MNLCACMGKIANDPYCPCEMKKRGMKVTITEAYCSPECFALLPNEDKETINRLKLKAAFLYMEQP